MNNITKQRSKLLAVDDDELTRKMLRLALSKYFDVDTCGSCAEFHNSTATKDYDLFLMDISLRDEKDGCDLTKELKQSDRFKSKPVIALTAFQSNKDRQRAIEAGIDLFLTKPVLPDDLVAALQSCVKEF